MKFKFPDFKDCDLEFRYENDEICVYGTSDGLMWLAEKCRELAGKTATTHMHLEEYDRLTEASIKATIAVFK